MKRLAGPRRQSAKERKAGAPLDFSATPEELAMLAEYNRIDVLMLMEIVDRVGLLTPEEQALWQLDQRINERGVHLDVNLLETALCLEQEAQREIRSQIAELTDGAVTTPNQRDQILKWLAAKAACYRICASAPSPTLCSNRIKRPGPGAARAAAERSWRSAVNSRPCGVGPMAKMNHASAMPIAFMAPRAAVGRRSVASSTTCASLRSRTCARLSRRCAPARWPRCAAAASSAHWRRSGRSRAPCRAQPRASGFSSRTCPASRPEARPLSAALPPSSSSGGISIVRPARR